MPIFEYHCNDCETEFEVLERARDANKLPKCPNCRTLLYWDYTMAIQTQCISG